MADIFISYAAEDKEHIGRIAGALEAQGWSVFWDHTIPASKTWRTYIGAALEEARCIVVAWSVHSVESTFVHEEADEGKKKGILVPLFLEEVAPPLGFRSIQGVKLTGWDGTSQHAAFRKLVDDMTLLLESPAQPDRIEGPGKDAKADESGPLLAAAGGKAAVEQASAASRFSLPMGTLASVLAAAIVVGLGAWVFRGDVADPLPAGHAIVFDGHTDYERSGFSFPRAALVAWNSGEADLLVENPSRSPSESARFFLQYEAGDRFTSAPQDRGAQSGILDTLQASLEDVERCPVEGYKTHRFRVQEGGVYCIRLRDGRHFAKVRVNEIQHDRIAFDWVYQPDLSREFP